MPGYDSDLFVDPVPRQLTCNICLSVVKNPVVTECDHLFCEDDLLDWLMRSNKCPNDRTPIIPENIKPAPKLIQTMLAELKVKCPHHEEGCEWTGQLEHLDDHVESCDSTPKDVLLKRVKEQDVTITALKAEVKDKNNQLVVMSKQLEKRTRELQTAMASLAVLSASCASDDEEDNIRVRRLPTSPSKSRRSRMSGTGPLSPSRAARAGPTYSDLQSLARETGVGLSLNSPVAAHRPHFSLRSPTSTRSGSTSHVVSPSRRSRTATSRFRATGNM